MRALKRNAVIIVVLLFVAAAVYLNWSYGKTEEDILTSGIDGEEVAETNAEDAESTETDLYFTENEEEDTLETSSGETDSEYFAQVRLDRTQARDEATETLKIITETDGASQDTIDDALSEIALIAERTEREAEIESMIMAKGFSECVVYMSGDGVTVTVDAPGEELTDSDVAKITDIITSETEFSAADLKIVEID